MDPAIPIESKFTKSQRNSGTQNEGLDFLLSDRRFQRVDPATKRKILALLPVSGDFGIQTFDAVMTSAPRVPITTGNIDAFFPDLTLIEMKSTKKPIRNSALNGFFFGATEREYMMAEALGAKYKFAFVVLNSDNDYGKPFAVLLTLAELQERTRNPRVQFQVNFRTDLAPGADDERLIRGIDSPGS